MKRVLETPTFRRHANKLFDQRSKEIIVIYLSENAEKGVMIRGTDGVRKLRIPASGRGKRGGARIIYYIQNDEDLILALDIYAKNEREDISRQRIKVLMKGITK